MLWEDTIQVMPLGDWRRLQCFVPDDLEEGEKLPVLYILDGQNAFIDDQSYAGKSWGFLDYVKKHSLRLVMVAIDCAPGPYERENEYGPWVIPEALSYHETKKKGKRIGGKGKAFMRWFVEVLKPAVDAALPTNPLDTAIVGSSMGGIMASYAALKYPHIFRKSASLSTAYWFYEDEFTKLIQESDIGALSCFYFDLGSDEGCGDDKVNEWYRRSNLAIFQMLLPRLEQLHFRYAGGASHNEWAWSQRVDYFMRLFYEDQYY